MFILINQSNSCHSSLILPWTSNGIEWTGEQSKSKSNSLYSVGWRKLRCVCVCAHCTVKLIAVKLNLKSLLQFHNSLLLYRERQKDFSVSRSFRCIWLNKCCFHFLFHLFIYDLFSLFFFFMFFIFSLLLERKKLNSLASFIYFLIIEI